MLAQKGDAQQRDRDCREVEKHAHGRRRQPIQRDKGAALRDGVEDQPQSHKAQPIRARQAADDGPVSRAAERHRQQHQRRQPVAQPGKGHGRDILLQPDLDQHKRNRPQQGHEQRL